MAIELYKMCNCTLFALICATCELLYATLSDVPRHCISLAIHIITAATKQNALARGTRMDVRATYLHLRHVKSAPTTPSAVQKNHGNHIDFYHATPIRISGSGGHKGGVTCRGGNRGRRCARVHPDYGAVLNDDDVGIFIGASHKVRTGGRNGGDDLLYFALVFRPLTTHLT